ncbi:hypothetical protein Goshw_004369 [Gossypium schwendimanii]|uniref:Uncharacterized protein n=1 Tax=Gossypium schwendimanii TaxID=34291 RepID=A0A7J9KK31_GOSSC|nr:hypothetical protein [Gossypium schwendimanii]
MAFARHLGLDKMVVEGDSLTVIKKALSSYFDLSPIDFIIQSKDYEENTGADLSTYRRRSVLPLCRVVVLFSSASLVCFCSCIWGVGMLSHNILVAGFGFVLPFGFPNLSFSVFFLFFKMGIFLVWLFNINRC